MIIISGPDNSGKSTLVNDICEAHPHLIPWKSKGPDSNYELWMEVLMSSPDRLSRLVCDRFFYSEYIYGPLIRGSMCVTIQQLEVIHSLLETAEPLVIQCHLIKDQVGFNNRPQLFDWETTLKTEDLFNQVLGPGLALQHWPSVSTQESHIRARVKLYLEMMDDWKELRAECPYGRGRMRRPTLMIVGEKFSTNNQWKTPFERSKSARLLHDVLRRTHFTMSDIWFTNAVKSSEALSPMNLAGLKQEVESIRPMDIIGLGNRASGLLSAIGQAHVKIRHPGWYLRRSSYKEAFKGFQEEFNLQMEIEEN